MLASSRSFVLWLFGRSLHLCVLVTPAPSSYQTSQCVDLSYVNNYLRQVKLTSGGSAAEHSSLFNFKPARVSLASRYISDTSSFTFKNKKTPKRFAPELVSH